MKPRRHDLTGDAAALNERLARRSARLNDLEAERLEREIGRSTVTTVAREVGVSPPVIEGARHSGPSTPVAIATIRGWLGGLP